jgi:hypothetical protein
VRWSILAAVFRTLTPVQRIACLILVSVHATLFVVLAKQGAPMRGDFERFWQIGADSRRPYRDFAVEYPPVAVAVFRTLATMEGRESFGYTLLSLNMAADALLIGTLMSGWGVSAAMFYVAGVLPMLPVLFYRFDLWPISVATLAVHAWRRRSATSGLAFALGFGLKLWPLLLSMWIVCDRDLTFRRRAFAVLAVGCLGIALGWIVFVGGFQGLIQVLTFREARGWSIESTVGAIVHLGDSTTVRVESGAWRVGRVTPFALLGLFVVTAPLSLIAAFRGIVTQRLGASWIAAIGIVLLGSPLLSPQFFAWLLPGAAIAWVNHDRAPALGVVVTLVLSVAILATYADLVGGVKYVELLAVGRNLVCLVTVISAALSLATTRSEHQTASNLQEQDLSGPSQ